MELLLLDKVTIIIYGKHTSERFQYDTINYSGVNEVVNVSEWLEAELDFNNLIEIEHLPTDEREKEINDDITIDVISKFNKKSYKVLNNDILNKI